jgi:hypothetical protein
MQNTHKKYFDHDMPVTSLCQQQYLNFCAEHLLQTVALYYKFREIFNKDFNIGFKLPRSDTSHKCDEFRTKIEDAKASKLLELTKELENARDLHHRKAASGQTVIKQLSTLAK